MSFESLMEYKKEIVVAAIVGIGGFLLGQSFQALENKAVMDSKNYVQEEMRKIGENVDDKIDNLNRNTQEKLNHYDEKVIQVLIDSSRTVKAAEGSLRESEAIIENAKTALKILDDKDSKLKTIIETNARITSESVAALLRQQIKGEILEEIKSQFNADFSALRMDVGGIDQKVNKLNVDIKYTIVNNIEKCPVGWVDQGVIGVVMQNADYKNNLGNGGTYTEGWTWTHPRLCKK